MNDQYSELYQSFQWLVPSQFNIAQACVYRWAENTLEGRRIAIYYEDGTGRREVWTYTRLAETARRLANGFVKMGVLPGDRVAVVLGQRPESVAACMAIFSVGAIAMPLSPSLSTDDLTMRLQDSGTHVAIVDAHTGPDVVKAQQRYAGLTQIVALDFVDEAVIAWRTLLARQAADFKPLPTRSDSPALLLYTCGATGAAKGVLLSHAALIGALPGFVASQNWFPRKGDIFWTPGDWSWSNSLLGALLPTLYFGHAIVGTLGEFSAEKAFALLARYRVTNLFIPPPMLQSLMRESTSPVAFAPLNLRAISSSGEPAGKAAFDWCQQVLGVPLNEMYAQAETGSVVGNSYRKWPAHAGSMGKPYPGHRVAVLDTEGNPCPTGTTGEIAINRQDIHGHPDPALFLRYWHTEASTQAGNAEQWYLTGDLATIDADGYYWHAGRRDDIFRSAGHLIGPAEIEDCLKTHTAVHAAAVIPKPDPQHGALIKAYIVLNEDARHVDPHQLQTSLHEFLGHRLAAHQLPREIEFVESLPTTNSGKLRRNVLRTREQQHIAK